MTAAELAKKLLDFYQDDPSRWTKGAFARDATGFKTHPGSSTAVSWCAIGAVRCQHGCVHALGDNYRLFVKLNDSCKDFAEFKSKLEEIANGY